MSLRRILCGLLAFTSSGLLVGEARAEARTFENPMYQGSRLAYCDSTGEVCGSEIANRWCVNEGYDFASSWRLAVDTGSVVGPARRNQGGQGFASITCHREGVSFRMPSLGAFERSTIVTPNQRAIETGIAPVEYRVLLPGCHQREPGTFLCESIHEYQHCRTLYRSGRVFGCRAGVAFDSGFARPVSAQSSTYDIEVESSASAVVFQDERGSGRARGRAEFVVDFDVPDLSTGEICLQRERYVYYPTGPMGGMEGIDETAECGVPIEGRFEPHEDDLLRAYDLCNSEGAWGSSIDQTIEILVASLYHVSSAVVAVDPYSIENAQSIVAPYVTVSAPMEVSCRM